MVYIPLTLTGFGTLSGLAVTTVRVGFLNGEDTKYF
jgi:hypothetical protein